MGKFKKNNQKGISLIVLVITIIVVIIIAAAVILTLTENNPIAEARKATFLNDVATFKDDLNMYTTNEYAKRMGDYDPSLLNATTSGLTYNGSAVSGQDNIYDVIPSLEGKNKYVNEFEIEAGGIKYVGTNTEKGDWAQNDAGIPSDIAKPSIDVTTANILPVKAGTNVLYTFDIAASSTIIETNLTGKIKILNNSGVELPTQPTVNIGSVTGTEKEKTVSITVVTTGMAEGSYKIKVLAGAVKTSTQESLEFVISTPFEVDNTAPNMPTITIDPTIATNGNVTVTLTKANAADTLEYSTNGTTWNAYTAPLTVTSNLTVYARETDSANNVSAQATQIITNIDKTVPQNATISLTTTGDKINGTITIADSGSGINVSQSKYIVATQSSAFATTDAVWNSATVMGTTSKSISETKADGTYYVQVLSTDNAGNKIVNVSSSITVIAIVNIVVTDTGYNSTQGLNGPVIATGMTPVKWNGSSWVDTTTSDTAWYNYASKQWANVRTADGSMWVWIPRYQYDIPATYEHTKNAGSISISFLNGTSTTATGSNIVHPAFTFGSTQLKGIWVAKFEASGTTSTVGIKPGNSPLTNITIDDSFNACRNMETTYGNQYGWGTSGTGIDTHLIKNPEWGAAAYLSHSVYGINGNITQNTVAITGGSSYSSNVSQSTTGNIYGIYDMVGGLHDLTAAYVNTGWSGAFSNGYALVNADSKYKNVYTAVYNNSATPTQDTMTGNYNACSSIKGDAIYETSVVAVSSTGNWDFTMTDLRTAWYQSTVAMPCWAGAFFTRGDHNASYSGYNSIFSVNGCFSGSAGYRAFRPTLAVSSGI